jgi:hypothetical protein
MWYRYGGLTAKTVGLDCRPLLAVVTAPPRTRITTAVQGDDRSVDERLATHCPGIGSPGMVGIVIVMVLVLVVTVTVVLMLVLGVVVVVVLGVVVVVVAVLVDGVVVSMLVDVVVVGAVVAVVLADVRDVVVTGVSGLLSLEFVPPKISKMISTSSTAPSAPNPTRAHGVLYQGLPGSSSGGSPGGPPGGSPGGCCPYAL